MAGGEEEEGGAGGEGEGPCEVPGGEVHGRDGGRG